MASNEKFEREFESFLTEEQSRLAVLYRKLPQAEPDAKLDAAVQAMARRDATGARHTYKPRRRWLPALGVAACAVLAAGIALRLGPSLRSDRDETGASTKNVISVPPRADSAPTPQLSRPVPLKESTTGAPVPASPSLDDVAKSAVAPPPSARAKAMSQSKAADNRPGAGGGLSTAGKSSAPAAQPQAFPAQAPESKRETDALERKQTATPGTQQMLHKLDSGSAAANVTRAAPAAAAPTRQAPALLQEESRTTLSAPPPASAPVTAAAPTQAQAESSNMARDEAPVSAAVGAAEKKSMQSQDPNASLYPEHWLANIRVLLRENRRDEALRSLEKFRKAYPDYQLPEDLRVLK